MIIREVKDSEKNIYNNVVDHVIQSWEWGQFRQKLGLTLVRLGHFEGKKLKQAYQLTLHPVPYLKQKIGYLPKGPIPNKEMVSALRKIGAENNAAFIKLEPSVIADKQLTNDKRLTRLGLIPSKKSLFTKYNFLVDLRESEEKLLASMHPKTRYNVNLAIKKGVRVFESTKDEDFETYLKLYFETTKRQKYFGHTPHYHRLLWQTLKPAGMARVLIAKYQPPGTPSMTRLAYSGKNQIPLVAWMLFNFKDTFYYPYGGSSTEYKEVMASNLVSWEAIKLGKKMGLKTFDMWGALAPDAKESDPWYGFHRFKAGYGGKLTEYVGTWDLVLKPQLYSIINTADRLRWTFLRTLRR